METKQLNLSKDIKEIESKILNQVMTTSKSILNAFMFHIIYSMNINEEKSLENARLVKEYREKGWKEALKKANGNEDKAYQFYISNVF
ncbi:MAG: hypothetical protein AABW57_00005 [Nanoarchaeota archaeon]